VEVDEPIELEAGGDEDAVLGISGGDHVRDGDPLPAVRPDAGLEVAEGAVLDGDAVEAARVDSVVAASVVASDR
jgi:hypothetical protein